jgi:pilus assembly protein Flp/PilA
MTRPERKGAKMTKLFIKAQNLLEDRKGVTAVEYGLIAALIAVVIMAALVTQGGNLTTIFNAIATRLAVPGR